jgi:hypothetical protein
MRLSSANNDLNGASLYQSNNRYQLGFGPARFNGVDHKGTALQKHRRPDAERECMSTLASSTVSCYTEAIRQIIVLLELALKTLYWRSLLYAKINMVVDSSRRN